MAVTSTPVLPQAPKNYKVQILNATGTALTTVATGGSNGSKIVALIAASTDTTARDCTYGITTGGTFYPLGTKTIAIGSGTVAGTPAVNLLDPTVTVGLPIDNDGQPYLLLTGAGDTLQAKTLTAVASGKEVDITAIGADF